MLFGELKSTSAQVLRQHVVTAAVVTVCWPYETLITSIRRTSDGGSRISCPNAQHRVSNRSASNMFLLRICMPARTDPMIHGPHKHLVAATKASCDSGEPWWLSQPVSSPGQSSRPYGSLSLPIIFRTCFAT